MADKAIVSHSVLNAIGQAIIDKGGATGPMLPSEMPKAIRDIPADAPGGGGGFPTSSYYPFFGSAGDILDSVDYDRLGFTRDTAAVVFYRGAASVATANTTDSFYLYNAVNACVNGVYTSIAAQRGPALSVGTTWCVVPVKKGSFDIRIPATALYVYSEASGTLSVVVNRNSRRQMVYAPNAEVIVAGGYNAPQYVDLVCRQVTMNGQYSYMTSGVWTFDSLVLGYNGAFNVPCASWVSYPKTLSALNDVSFSDMAAGYPESFATFDESGAISGGFVLGIAPPAGARHTITFGQKIYNCYSAEQISKIEQLLNSKNWTVAW